jgi:tetratricopeptide (TPR) repeat protein
MVTRIFLCDERTEPDIRLYIKEAIEDIGQGERYIITWSCSNVQSIKVGDRAYFQRVGFAPEGYFARGQVVAADREYQLRLKYPRYRDLSEAYDIDFYPNNFRVWVAWDSCTDYDRPLPIADLRQKSQFRGAFFDAPDSGVVFKEQYVPRLDRAWDRHSLNLARQSKGIRLVDIYYAWAQEDSQQGFTEEALDNYAQAIETQPDYIRAYIGRGDLYFGLKEFDNAIADYTAATGIRSKLAKIAFYQRGLTYAKLGQQDKAAADFNEALQIDFEYPEAQFGLANALFKLKEFEKAVASYTQALNLNPDNIQAYYRRGRCYFVLKQFSEAIADYTAAIKLKPDYADAFYYRAVAASQPEMDKDRQAIDDLEKAAQLYREQSRLDRYDRAADLLETIAATAKERARQKAQQKDATMQSAQLGQGAVRQSRQTLKPRSENTNPALTQPTAAPGPVTIDRREPVTTRDTHKPDDRLNLTSPDANLTSASNSSSRAVDVEPEVTAVAYTPASPEEVWGNEEIEPAVELTTDEVDLSASDSAEVPANRPEVAATGEIFNDRLAQMDSSPTDAAALTTQITDSEAVEPERQNLPDRTDRLEASATGEPAAAAIAMPASSGFDDFDQAQFDNVQTGQQPDTWEGTQTSAADQSNQEQSNEFAWLEQDLSGGDDAIAPPAAKPVEDMSDYLSDNLTDNLTDISDNQIAPTANEAEQAIAIGDDQDTTRSGELLNNWQSEQQSNRQAELPVAEFTAPNRSSSNQAVEFAKPIEAVQSQRSTQSTQSSDQSDLTAPTPPKARSTTSARQIEFADFDDELPLRTGSYDAIERAALVIITSQYIRDGWAVRSVEKSKRGYDLACRKDGTREDVSVRGVAGRNPTFELNSDEIREAEYNDNFVLWVVSSALGNYNCQRWSGQEILLDFDLKPMSFVAKPKEQ